jgi:hypothetical protein
VMILIWCFFACFDAFLSVFSVYSAVFFVSRSLFLSVFCSTDDCHFFFFFLPLPHCVAVVCNSVGIATGALKRIPFELRRSPLSNGTTVTLPLPLVRPSLPIITPQNPLPPIHYHFFFLIFFQTTTTLPILPLPHCHNHHSNRADLPNPTVPLPPCHCHSLSPPVLVPVPGHATALALSPIPGKLQIFDPVGGFLYEK